MIDLSQALRDVFRDQKLPSWMKEIFGLGASQTLGSLPGSFASLSKAEAKAVSHFLTVLYERKKKDSQVLNSVCFPDLEFTIDQAKKIVPSLAKNYNFSTDNIGVITGKKTTNFVKSDFFAAVQRQIEEKVGQNAVGKGIIGVKILKLSLENVEVTEGKEISFNWEATRGIDKIAEYIRTKWNGGIVNNIESDPTKFSQAILKIKIELPQYVEESNKTRVKSEHKSAAATVKFNSEQMVWIQVPPTALDTELTKYYEDWDKNHDNNFLIGGMKNSNTNTHKFTIRKDIFKQYNITPGKIFKDIMQRGKESIKRF